MKEGIGVSNFVLAGHSLGGYLSARYAIKYPSNGMLESHVMIELLNRIDCVV